MGQTTTKPGLKPPPFGCPRFWADSLVWIQVGIFTAPGGIGQAHSCTCSQSECSRGMAGPSRRVWDLLSVSRVAGTAGPLPQETFLSTWCLILVDPSIHLFTEWKAAFQEGGKVRPTHESHTASLLPHPLCQSRSQGQPTYKGEGRPHFLTEGGGKNLSFLIHHEYRNLECSYHNEDFNLKQLQRIKISSVWNKNESCIFPFQIQYVHLY